MNFVEEVAPIFIEYASISPDKKKFISDLSLIKDKGFSGIFFPLVKPFDQHGKNKLVSFYPASWMVEIVKKADLKSGLILDCFHSPQLWSVENFSPPVNSSGVSYTSDSWYKPICPNNPMGRERLEMILEKLSKVTVPDFLYLNHLRFPFFWEKEDLDIQAIMPPYCYCPFCIGEFSSIIGEVVTSPSQLVELMPEWLEWRAATITNLLLNIKETISGASKIVVAIPPLSYIDIPFTTGQLPLVYSDENCIVSPLLRHLTKEKDFLWVEDMLYQYQMEIASDKLLPNLQVSNSEEMSKVGEWEKIYSNVIISDLK